LTAVPRLALLAFALLLAQLAMVGHGVEHAFHDSQDTGETCVECLALPGFAAVPAAKLRLPGATPAPMARDVTVPPAPTFARHQAFRSRVPPARHH
jgi:hypothetical protein